MTVPFVLSSLRCRCGSAEIVAISPGREPVAVDVAGVPSIPGEDAVGTCLACWPAMKGYQQDLFGEAPV